MEDNKSSKPTIVIKQEIRIYATNRIFIVGNYLKYRFIAEVRDRKTKTGINGGCITELSVLGEKLSESLAAFYKHEWIARAETQKDKDACSAIIRGLEQLPLIW